jgi:hypothetical protein
MAKAISTQHFALCVYVGVHRCHFQEPEAAQQPRHSPEMQQLLASWAPYLAVLQLQAPATYQPGAAAEAGLDSASAAAHNNSDTQPTAAARAEQPCACDSSSKSSSATNSPRSSMSSYASACVSTSTFSSTVVGSPAGCCPANWVLSRSSSCCDCDSQHSASAGAAAAACSRSRAAAEEQQREALTALVASARSKKKKNVCYRGLTSSYAATGPRSEFSKRPFAGHR